MASTGSTSERGQRGFATSEAMIALGVFGIVIAAAMAFMSTGMTVVADQQTDGWLGARARAAALKLIDDVEDADPFDPSFAVSDTQLRFREVVGATPLGGRVYGDTIEYRIEGPDADARFQLVRTVTSEGGTLLSQEVAMTGLTSPTDAAAPSRLGFDTPFVTVQLVAEGSGSRAGSSVRTGIHERVRLRY